MKNIFVTILIIHLSFSIIDAQNYKAYYQYRCSLDSLNTADKLQFTTILAIDKKQGSYFATVNNFKMDSLFQLLDKKEIGYNDAYGQAMSFNKGIGFYFIVLKNHNAQILTFYDKIGTERFQYQENSQLHWGLIDKSEVVTGYKCQKATTYYAGRYYDAWYTTEIPISDGPYKFSGLPGLIVKIQDRENHHSFTLKQFEQVDFLPVSIANYSNNKYAKTKRDVFHKAFWEHESDPTIYMEASGAVLTDEVKRMVRTRAARHNNYLELSID